MKCPSICKPLCDSKRSTIGRKDYVKVIKTLVILVLPLLPIAHEQQNLLCLARSSVMMFRQLLILMMMI